MWGKVVIGAVGGFLASIASSVISEVITDWILNDDDDSGSEHEPDQRQEPSEPQEDPSKDGEIIIALRDRLNGSSQKLLEEDSDFEELYKKHLKAIQNIERNGVYKPYVPEEKNFVDEIKRLLEKKLKPEVSYFKKEHGISSKNSLRSYLRK